MTVWVYTSQMMKLLLQTHILHRQDGYVTTLILLHQQYPLFFLKFLPPKKSSNYTSEFQNLFRMKARHVYLEKMCAKESLNQSAWLISNLKPFVERTGTRVKNGKENEDH
mmetsp:Transcript_44687/g.52357  ORF Transcript_44687/g.52357 Transcript_44687/m.52357 type:complete len:110 (+) Transcript_44687:292-621(+)